jgi:hypothetical protein
VNIAIYRQSTGEWFIRRANSTLQQIPWGSPPLGDVPVQGDYDADGKTDVAVYRKSTGEWLIRRSSDGGLSIVPWGAPTLGDIPIPGRY